MTKAEILILANQIEDFVSTKIDLNTYDKNFHKVVKVLANRYILPELDLDIKKK